MYINFKILSPISSLTKQLILINCFLIRTHCFINKILALYKIICSSKPSYHFSKIKYKGCQNKINKIAMKLSQKQKINEKLKK